MKKLLIFLFILTSIGCYSQINRLTVHFSPSFFDKSDVLIEKGISNYSITISNGEINEKCQLPKSSLADLEQFFVDYFQKRFTIDSLEQVRIYELEQKGISSFSINCDGITVNGALVDNKGVRPFEFWSPKSGTIDNTFMHILFKLMNATFKKPKIINYVETLGCSFDLGLGLKQLSVSPLKYKLYGNISSCDEKELTDFFSKLPTNKKIYFDLSNLNYMNEKYYEIFKSLSDKNSKIYLINCPVLFKKKLIAAGMKKKSFR